jgi:hypothetical protein
MLETGQHHEKCCLAGPGWAQHAHELSLANRQIEIIDNGHHTERFADLVEMDKRVTHHNLR